MKQEKTVAFSATEQAQLLMPENINGRSRLFGGRLMEWIDSLASIVARRHAQCDVITVCVDSLEFIAPAYVNSTIILKGKLTYTGKTSMEVKVDTFCEALDGSRYQINRAYLVFVAVDNDDKPVEVPKLILKTDEEKTEWESALKRREYRMANKAGK